MAHISDRVNRLAASATFAMLQKSNELSAQGVDVVNMSVSLNARYRIFSYWLHTRQLIKKGLS